MFIYYALSRDLKFLKVSYKFENYISRELFKNRIKPELIVVVYCPIFMFPRAYM